MQRQPVSWQVTADGARMIGHVILQKSYDGEDSLKVSGGRLLPSGSRGAVVDAVKCGSIADLEGHVLPGEYHTTLHGHTHTTTYPATHSPTLYFFSISVYRWPELSSWVDFVSSSFRFSFFFYLCHVISLPAGMCPPTLFCGIPPSFNLNPTFHFHLLFTLPLRCLALESSESEPSHCKILLL